MKRIERNEYAQFIFERIKMSNDKSCRDITEFVVTWQNHEIKCIHKKLGSSSSVYFSERVTIFIHGRILRQTDFLQHFCVIEMRT